VRDRIKTAVTAVPFPARSAEAAGMALGRLSSDQERARLSIDVMVMAFAATFGGALVYTSDVQDMQRLTTYFPSVRVLGV
jgi:predicted nucleic acid-binding protein